MPLLDTDVAVDLLRAHPPALQWLATLGADPIVVPGYVAMEVIAGCRDLQQQQRTEAELANYRTVWLSAGDCEVGFSYFKALRLSHGLGLLDALIARTAVVLNMPLQTFNVKHFGAVPNLIVNQPYKR